MGLVGDGKSNIVIVIQLIFGILLDKPWPKIRQEAKRPGKSLKWWEHIEEGRQQLKAKKMGCCGQILVHPPTLKSVDIINCWLDYVISDLDKTSPPRTW